MRLPKDGFPGDDAIANRFVEEEPSLNQPATLVAADMMNHIAYEIINVILDAGIMITDSTTNEDLLLQAIDSKISTAISGALGSYTPTITVKDEGITQGSATSLNFTGGGVTANFSGSEATINVPTPTINIKDEGVSQGTVTTLDFVGSNITTTVVGNTATVTVAAGSTGVAIQDEGVSQGTASTINFTGTGVTASVAGGIATVNVTGGGGGSSSGGYKNWIDNSSLRTWQKGTSSANLISSSTTGLPDRFRFFTQGGTLSGSGITISRQNDTPDGSFMNIGTTNAGTIQSLRVQVNTAQSNTVTNASILHRMEGYDWANLYNKDITLSFWVKSATFTGTASIFLSNSSENQAYVATYTINALNTWEKKVINITGITPGTGGWGFTTGVGVNIHWTLNSIAANETSTLNSWALLSNIYGATAQGNILGTVGSAFFLAAPQLEIGTTVNDYRVPDLLEERSKCNRYYNKTHDYDIAPTTANPQNSLTSLNCAYNPEQFHSSYRYPVASMRSNPTISIYSSSASTLGSANLNGSEVTITSVISDSRGVKFVTFNGATDGQTLQYHVVAASEL